MEDHLARLLARARIPIWYALIFRLHFEAFKYFKERISYHIILSVCLLGSIQMWKGIRIVMSIKTYPSIQYS